MTFSRSLWLALVLALLGAFVGTCAAGPAPSARASHILVDTEAQADELAKEINAATDLEATFAKLAADHSKCPSGRRGGDLGTFGRGQMVAPFDKVVFEKRLGVVEKVKTQFGWHLILITERSGVDEAALAEALEEEEQAMKRDL